MGIVICGKFIEFMQSLQILIRLYRLQWIFKILLMHLTSLSHSLKNIVDNIVTVLVLFFSYFFSMYILNIFKVNFL